MLACPTSRVLPSAATAGWKVNVEIKDAAGASIFKGEIFNGVEVRTYNVQALPAGTYTFICTVHPNMIGTLKVGG